MRIVLKPILIHGCVNCRPVSANCASWCDVLSQERDNRFDGGPWNSTKTNASEALGLVHLNSNSDGNQVAAIVGFRAGALGLWLGRVFSAQRQEGLIDFDCAAQQVTIGSHHRAAKPVQHGPCGLIAIQAEHALQSKGTDALLLIGDVPSRSEPQPKRSTGLVEDCSCRHTALMPTTSANQPPPSRASGLVNRAARRAAKSFRPSQVLKVSCAGIFGGKPVLKFNPVVWVTFACTLPNFVHRRMIGLVELNG